MSNLNFKIEPTCIPLECVSVIHLWVQHDFPEALVELRFRIRGSTSIQILGQEQYRIPRLEPEKGISFEVKVKGSATAVTEITIDRISTRMSGRSYEFSALKLPIQVMNHIFRPESLSLMLLDAQSKQNAWSFLKLRLFNNNSFDIKPIQIHFSIDNAQINAGCQRIQMDSLTGNQGADIQVEFKPGQNGVFRIVTRLDGQVNHTPVSAFFRIPFSVQSDEIHQTAGDSVIINRTTYYGATQENSSQKSFSTNFEGGGENFPNPLPEPSETIICPKCLKENLKMNNEGKPTTYCNYCSEPLRPEGG